MKDVFPGEDGKVRKVTVQYKSYRTGDRVHEYRGARDIVVSRAVQRLTYLFQWIRVTVLLKSRNANDIKDIDHKCVRNFNVNLVVFRHKIFSLRFRLHNLQFCFQSAVFPFSPIIPCAVLFFSLLVF